MSINLMRGNVRHFPRLADLYVKKTPGLLNSFICHSANEKSFQPSISRSFVSNFKCFSSLTGGYSYPVSPQRLFHNEQILHWKENAVKALSFSTSSDNSSSDSRGTLVYQGRLHKMFRTLKLFSLTTSALGLALQPYLWITYQDLTLGAKIPLFAAVNLFVFINPFLIHFVSKKYVNELYFCEDTQTFTVTVMTFFARRETITFSVNDVQVPDVPGMFSMLTVKGRPLFIDENDFSHIEVYKHLMGFDKPLDLTYRSETRPDDNIKKD